MADDAAAAAAAASGDEMETEERAGSDVIVLLPGSRNLVVGLGCHSLPKSIPHAIARPLRQQGSPHLVEEPGEAAEAEREAAFEVADMVLLQ